MMERGVKIFPKFQESLQNSRCEIGDEFPRCGPTNITGQPTKLNFTFC